MCPDLSILFEHGVGCQIFCFFSKLAGHVWMWEDRLSLEMQHRKLLVPSSHHWLQCLVCKGGFSETILSAIHFLVSKILSFGNYNGSWQPFSLMIQSGKPRVTYSSKPAANSDCARDLGFLSKQTVVNTNMEPRVWHSIPLYSHYIC